MKSTRDTTHTTEPAAAVAAAAPQRRSHRRTPQHTNNNNSNNNSSNNNSNINNSNNHISNSNNSNNKRNDIAINSNSNSINEAHQEERDVVSAADVSVSLDMETEPSPHDPTRPEQPSLSPEISLFANISGFFSKIARSVSLSNNDETSNSTTQQEPFPKDPKTVPTRPSSLTGNSTGNTNGNSIRETPNNHRNHGATVASAAHAVTAVQRLSRDHPKQSGISHPRSTKHRKGSPKRPMRSNQSSNPSTKHHPIIMKGLKVEGSVMTATGPDSDVESAQQQTITVTRLDSTKIPMPPMATMMPVHMSIQMPVQVPIPVPNQGADQYMFDAMSDQDLSQLEFEMKKQHSNSGFKPAVHQLNVDLDSLFMAEDKLQKRRLVCCRGIRRAPCIPTAVMCCLYKNYSVGCRKACGCFYPWNQEDLIGMGAVAMLQLKSVEHAAECCCGLSYQCCCDVFSVTTSCWKTICCGMNDSDVDGMEKARRFTVCGGLVSSGLSQTFKCVKSTAFSTSKCSSGLASSVYEYLKEIFSSAGSSSADAGDAVKEFACNACQDSFLRYCNPCEWCQTIIALR